jgi:hypothetical protein
MTPVVTPEHLTELASKAVTEAEREAVSRLSISLADLVRLGARVDQDCVTNRIEAGEAPSKVKLPSFANEMSSKAKAEITKLLMRKVRRAESVAAAASLLAERMSHDIEFLRQGTTDPRVLQRNRGVIEEELKATLAFRQQLHNLVGTSQQGDSGQTQ